MNRRVLGCGLLALALAGAPAASIAAPPRAAEPAGAGATCSKLPAGKRLVKLNLKPDTDVSDLVAWISAVTCKPFIVPDVPAAHAKVTIVAPGLITPGEAYRLFLDALDAVGLTVYTSGGFLRVIESQKAKAAPIPVVGFDG